MHSLKYFVFFFVFIMYTQRAPLYFHTQGVHRAGIKFLRNVRYISYDGLLAGLRYYTMQHHRTFREDHATRLDFAQLVPERPRHAQLAHSAFSTFASAPGENPRYLTTRSAFDVQIHVSARVRNFLGAMLSATSASVSRMIRK